MSTGPLTRDGLGGIWAGLPTPWDEGGRLDADAFEESAYRVATWGVAGVYTTGSTGEWFALDDDEFAALIDALARARRRAAADGIELPLQAGVTATSTHGVLRRAEIALVRGIDALQVALPPWIVLDDAEVATFFAEIRAAYPGVPIVHYDVARAGRMLDGPTYAAIAADTPELIGAKVTGSDDALWADIRRHAPELALLVGETLLPRRAADGARGSCSSFIYYAPALMMRLWEGVRDGDEAAVAAALARLEAFVADAVVPIVEEGFDDAAIDKCFAAAAGHLPIRPTVRGPYSAVAPERVEGFARLIAERYPDFLERPATAA